MNAGHLILGYMPPFQAILFPVCLRSRLRWPPYPCPHALLHAGQACSQCHALQLLLLLIASAAVDATGEACCCAVQDKKTLDASFATIVGVCAFVSNVIIGAICEVSAILKICHERIDVDLCLPLFKYCDTPTRSKGYLPGKASPCTEALRLVEAWRALLAFCRAV